MAGLSRVAFTATEITRGGVRIVLIVITQTLSRPRVSYHFQVRHLTLEPIVISSSCLPHKDPRPRIELHGVWRTLELHHLRLRIAALVEGHLVFKDRQRESSPAVHQTRHVEAGRLI